MFLVCGVSLTLSYKTRQSVVWRNPHWLGLFCGKKRMAIGLVDGVAKKDVVDFGGWWWWWWWWRGLRLPRFPHSPCTESWLFIVRLFSLSPVRDCEPVYTCVCVCARVCARLCAIGKKQKQKYSNQRLVSTVHTNRVCSIHFLFTFSFHVQVELHKGVNWGQSGRGLVCRLIRGFSFVFVCRFFFKCWLVGLLLLFIHSASPKALLLIEGEEEEIHKDTSNKKHQTNEQS